MKEIIACVFFYYLALNSLGEDNSIILVLEPLLGIFLSNLVASSYFTLAPLSSCYSLSWSLKNYVEIHTWKVKTNKKIDTRQFLFHIYSYAALHALRERERERKVDKQAMSLQT